MVTICLYLHLQGIRILSDRDILIPGDTILLGLDLDSKQVNFNRRNRMKAIDILKKLSPLQQETLVGNSGIRLVIGGHKFEYVSKGLAKSVETGLVDNFKESDISAIVVDEVEVSEKAVRTDHVPYSVRAKESEVKDPEPEPASVKPVSFKAKK